MKSDIKDLYKVTSTSFSRFIYYGIPNEYLIIQLCSATNVSLSFSSIKTLLTLHKFPGIPATSLSFPNITSILFISKDHKFRFHLLQVYLF